MKNPIKKIAALATALALTILMTSCAFSGELKGTYVATGGNLFSGLPFSSITFSNNNRVSMSAMGIVGTSGTYQVTGDTIELRYKEPSFTGSGKDVVKKMSFERSGKSIFLDGFEFRKE